ncbi:MAG TPA: sigma-70 family RNA polymerase sigma factor [Actinomycetes bacterium]|jgi:RNA polymerase sigma factor (sigma-70 family)|nr:sigma-70 family RNA polymerase sigma factor [Actinomycetes bacterium]
MTDENLGWLLAAASGGDQDAWGRLVGRFSGLVWAVVRSFRLEGDAAADVSQTTWLRLVEHLGDIRDPARLGSWLATTARRESIRTLKLSGRQLPTDEESQLEPAPAAQNEVSLHLLRKERDVVLWRAFETLSARCRQLLRVLMADPAPTYAEVSAALAMPLGSIGPVRGRCLAALRQQLERLGILSAEPGS